MKIGMILDAEFPPDPRVENEAISLVKAGFDVFLFCLSYQTSNQENYKGIEVRRYQSSKLEYKLSALTYTIPLYTNAMKQKIHHFISENDIDALHVHDIRVAEAVYRANTIKKLPVVLDLHDNYPEVMKFYPHLQKFPGKYIISPKKWKRKESEFIHKADQVITVSPEFIQSLEDRFPKLKSKFKLVPNTIRKSFYSDYTIDESITERFKNNFTLLYLGDTHIRRGLETAIKAIPNLIDEIPNIKLVIVGKNTTDYILKDLVKELNVSAYVSFEGWQNMNLFQSYILASDICISPLQRNIQHDMAYANKLFQYMSFAKSILVSDAIAQKRLVEQIDAGLVHTEKEPKDFADKVIQLYRNPSERESFGKNGEAYIKNEFHWEQTSLELITLYKNLQN